MARVSRGDARAFEGLYDGYHRLVYGIALRIVGSAESAEDVTQAVFLKLWNAPEAFAGGNFGAWLSRVARNRALDLVRTRAAQPHAELPVDLPLATSLDDVVFAALDAACVRDALATLPPEQRAPIELGFFEGITHEEIARRLDVPLGTIKTRIRSGLRKMREHLVTRVGA